LAIKSGTATLQAQTGNNLLQEGWNILDPDNDDMLEAWIMFCIAVAGKTAKTTIRALNNFLSERRVDESPFQYVGYLDANGLLRRKLEQHKTGQYWKLTHAWVVLCRLTPTQLRTWTPEQLEGIPGIGPKTSRFFIQSTRENTRFAVLDTHILAYMRDLGYDVPKSTPTGQKYAVIEKQYLDLADRLGKTPRELDTEIWLSRARI
jgi:thermostable 8-oxoguanine DNA glycosylase